jgi:hypothetical protein
MPRKLTYAEKRQRLNAWLHRADEVLEEYGEEKDDPLPDLPPAA